MAGACMDRPTSGNRLCAGRRDAAVALPAGCDASDLACGEGGAVFQCVFAAGREHAGHAAVAGAVTVAALGLASYRWIRAQPAAISLHSDGVTLTNRTSEVRPYAYRGMRAMERSTARTDALRCAWKARNAARRGRLRGRRHFRQLAVQARRAAASHL